MVVPGANNVETYYSLKLATQFGSENVDPSKYYNATTPVTITGATTGVEAEVIGFQAGTTTEQPLLFLNYTRAGTDNISTVFADGENISADVAIFNTPQYHTLLTLHPQLRLLLPLRM